MKKIAAFLLALALFSPASAESPIDILKNQDSREILSKAAQHLNVDLPSELVTNGQMDVFREVTSDKEFGTQLASHLLQAALKGDVQSSLPQAMDLVRPDQRRKLQLSGQQTDFLFSVLQSLSKQPRQ